MEEQVKRRLINITSAEPGWFAMFERDGEKFYAQVATWASFEIFYDEDGPFYDVDAYCDTEDGIGLERIDTDFGGFKRYVYDPKLIGSLMYDD